MDIYGYIYIYGYIWIYMVTWIPSIYPSHVSINIPYMDPMGWQMHGVDFQVSHQVFSTAWVKFINDCLHFVGPFLLNRT